MIKAEVHLTILNQKTDIYLSELRKDVEGLGINIVHIIEGSFSDIMTKTKMCVRTLDEVHNLIKLQKEKIQHLGYRVIRDKIEILPDQQFLSNSLYCESHIQILVSPEDRDEVEKLVLPHDCHLSKNLFKQLDNGMFIQMITFREDDYITLSLKVINFITSISKHFEVYKVVTEMVVHDTNRAHDNAWISL